MRTLRFISTGPSSADVSVVDADTGEPLQNVVAVQIVLRAGALNRATVEFEGVEFDLIAHEDAP